jgi:hypothetical protein
LGDARGGWQRGRDACAWVLAEFSLDFGILGRLGRKVRQKAA